jgi:hypothetical protein
MSLELSGNGVVTGLNSVGSSDLGTVLGSKLDLAGGKILQIVRTIDSGTSRSTTSTSFVDVTGMSVTITPQKSDSAVIVIATFIAGAIRVPAGDAFSLYQITDSSNNSLSGVNNLQNRMFSNETSRMSMVGIGYATPGVITAVTYKLRFAAGNASTSTECLNGSQAAQMYAIEVSA